MLIRCEIAKREKFEISTGIHRYNSLVIALSGEFEYVAENKKYIVTPFKPVFFKRGVLYSKKVIKPVEYIIISSLNFTLGKDVLFEYSEEDEHRLKNTINHLIYSIKNDAPDDVIEHFVNDIFLTSRKYKSENIRNELLPAYEYICENLSSELSLGLLSEISFCSVQTLINRFKKYTGKTPVEYITNMRIKKAKDLLLNTDCSIAQISEVCGFENVYYFSNVFKKKIGLSPSVFRNSSMM